MITLKQIVNVNQYYIEQKDPEQNFHKEVERSHKPPEL